MLVLPIKKKWFYMILTGKKREEYRDVKPYYTTRLNKIFNMVDDIPLDYAETQVRFTNGYGYKVPAFIADCHLVMRIFRFIRAWFYYSTFRNYLYLEGTKPAQTRFQYARRHSNTNLGR